jgi:WXXGXW repeat (2 copies)
MRILYFCLIFALVMALALAPAASHAQIAVGISVGFPPPDLPVYDQPVCPGEGYMWSPGFWAWDDSIDDYYWVPGTWVLAPEPGFLWTPGYWAWSGNAFVFNEGYWSFGTVGFYGGIDYGFGYFGTGYEGGRWEGNRFVYNQTVNNINTTVVHNVYSAPVNQNNRARVSFNGGQGGINARPTPQEERAAQARHLPPIANQRQQVQAARSNPQLRAKANQGKPPVAATAKPGEFSGRGVVQAREGGTLHRSPVAHGNARGDNVPRPGNAGRPGEAPPSRMEHANRGNPEIDRNKQERDNLSTRQAHERQQLQQQQERERQRMAGQNDPAARQQMEQRHQQQNNEMAQRHASEQSQARAKQPEKKEQQKPSEGPSPR